MATSNKNSRKWIFLRGLARHSIHWGPFYEAFQKHFPNDEIELLDVRGNGSLAYSESYIDLRMNVPDLRSRSQFIREGHAVNLMTISMGSMIGVEWAWRYPDEIDSLVMVNTSDSGASQFFERLRPQNYFKVFELLVAGKNSPLEIEKSILKMMINDPDQKEKIEKWAKKFSEHPPTSKKNILRQITAAAKYRFPNSRSDIPMLLLASTKDQFVAAVCTQRIADKWELSANFHPTAGHDLCFEDPDWICDQIAKWSKDSTL